MAVRKRRSISDSLERLLTSGSAAAVLALGAAATAVILVGATIATLRHIHAGDGDLSFIDASWQVLQRTIDPGQLSGEPTWESRVFLLIVTAIGLLLISTLISIINSTIERRIEAARRGRRKVTAVGHVVILGWNDLGPKYTEELAEAYEDTSFVHVVVLADVDPVELVREVQDDLIDRREIRPKWSIWGSRDDGRDSSLIRRPDQWMTARRGDPTDTHDLLTLARVREAKSVIVVSPNHSDAETTQYVLSVFAALQVRTDQPQRTTPLTVIAPFDSISLATRLERRVERLSAQMAATGRPTIHLIAVTPELVRTGIAAQVAPHRGLSTVYRDLLNFDDSELYVLPADPERRTFGDVVLAEHVTVLGLVDHDRVDLWPRWDTPLADRGVLMLAETESLALSAMASAPTPLADGQERIGRAPSPLIERFLIIGWNEGAEHLLIGLERRLRQPHFTVLLDEQDAAPQHGIHDIRRRITGSLDDPLDDPLFVQQFDHALVLAHDELDDPESDARVLVDVLACRVQATVDGRERPLTVVAEFRQRSIKHVAGAGARLADDLLVSDSLSASTTVQLAIHPELAPVFRELLIGSDAHVSFVPVHDGLESLVGSTWATVRREFAHRTGEIPVAVRSAGPDPKVTVNPSSSRVLAEHEEVIVLSRRNDDI